LSFLLDTHVIWWAFTEPERLRPAVVALLTNLGPGLHYSPLSLFELAVKRAKGRLSFDDGTILGGLAELKFRELPVRPQHALRAERCRTIIATRSIGCFSPKPSRRA
jgi:PIN domain nuclease of toxin-antitoxin system